MEKELFIALCDQLKNKVPELRWIDSDQGQLNVSERPPVEVEEIGRAHV